MEGLLIVPREGYKRNDEHVCVTPYWIRKHYIKNIWQKLTQGSHFEMQQNLISGILLEVLRDFLNYRKQRVVPNGKARCYLLYTLINCHQDYFLIWKCFWQFCPLICQWYKKISANDSTSDTMEKPMENDFWFWPHKTSSKDWS